MPAPLHRRALECLLIFVALPPLLALLRPRLIIFTLLWVAALSAGYLLRRAQGYDFRADWNRRGLDRAALRAIGLRFVPCALALFFFTWWIAPGRLFTLPLHRPALWLTILLLYPPLSALPQELIYRSFFLRRYVGLFATEFLLRLACALTFGWVHVVFLNPVAIALSAVGGWFFADTYRKTRSLAAACFEHALYGCAAFTLGLGMYFYNGG